MVIITNTDLEAKRPSRAQSGSYTMGSNRVNQGTAISQQRSEGEVSPSARGGHHREHPGSSNVNHGTPFLRQTGALDAADAAL
jgi:hypothetical protein